MVKTRTHHRHRSRRYRYQSPYPLHQALKWRSGVFFLYALMVMVLCLLLNRQPGLAFSVQAQTTPPPLFKIVAALGRAFRTTPYLQAVAITQQGSQVVLNGTSYSVAWSRQQSGRIGIADAGLIQAMGLEVLSTEEATVQPVAWFSDPQASSIALSAWQTGSYRFLDISELARQYGWQVSVNGTSLLVSTPTAHVSSIRQGQQAWGDRLVIDLDQAAPWHISEQPGELTVTLDAHLSPALAQTFRTQRGRYIQSLVLAPKGNQTVLRLTTPATIRSRVWSVPNPNRVLIDLRPDALVERNILWTPGVRWRQQWVSLGSDRFPVVSLEVDPRQPGVSLKPIVSNLSSVVGTSPLATTAQNYQAIAAINGGFFNRNNQLPLGAIRKDSRWVSGPILNRGAIAWNDAGQVAIGRLKLQETLITNSGQRLPIVHLNSGYVGKGIYRHTQEWGSSYSPILNNEQILVVRNNQIVAQHLAQNMGQTLPIPADGYLLVIREDNAALNALPIGTTVSLESGTVPVELGQYPHILGAGPLLIQNRQIVLNALSEEFSEAFNRQLASRSVIATTAQGTLMLITIHQRIGGQGPSLAETARLVQQMGATQALNLDGGSSTALYLGGRLLDRIPSTAAQVHNGIGVFVQAQ